MSKLECGDAVPVRLYLRSTMQGRVALGRRKRGVHGSSRRLLFPSWPAAAPVKRQKPRSGDVRSQRGFLASTTVVEPVILWRSVSPCELVECVTTVRRSLHIGSLQVSFSPKVESFGPPTSTVLGLGNVPDQNAVVCNIWPSTLLYHLLHASGIRIRMISLTRKSSINDAGARARRSARDVAERIPYGLRVPPLFVTKAGRHARHAGWTLESLRLLSGVLSSSL